MDQPFIFVCIFSGVLAFVGLVFLIIGLAMLYHKKKKENRCTARTYGRVTDVVARESYDSDGMHSVSWHPVFEYHIGSLALEKEYAYGSGKPKYTRGQTVEIHYNPVDYNEYYVDGDALPKTFAVVFTAIGAGAILIAVLSAVFMLRFGL